MRNIYIFALLMMTSGISGAPRHKTACNRNDYQWNIGDEVDDNIANIDDCISISDGHISRRSSGITSNDIDREKLLAVVSRLLEQQYNPFQMLFVFKGKKRDPVKWKPWLFNQKQGNIDVG